MMRAASSHPRDRSSRIQIDKWAPRVDLCTTVQFTTWNVLTLNGVGCQVPLINELAKYNIAKAGIQEAQLPGHDLVNGVTVIHSGQRRGVALILHPLLNITHWYLGVPSLQDFYMPCFP